MAASTAKRSDAARTPAKTAATKATAKRATAKGAKKATAKRATAKSAAKKATATSATAEAAAKTATTAESAESATTSASAPRARGALEAGAARASGERKKRRSTPLLQSAPAQPVLPAMPPSPGPGTSEAPTPVIAAPEERQRKLHRPHPVAKAVPTSKAVAKTGARPAGPKRRSTAPRPSQPAPAPAPAAARGPLKAVRDDVSVSPAPAAPGHVGLAPGVEELLRAGVAALRVAAEASGLAPEDVERQVASTLSFLRRRLTGDYDVDEFGFDEDFTRARLPPVAAAALQVVVPGRGPRHREHPRRGWRPRRRQPLRHVRHGLADDAGRGPRRAPSAPAPADARRRPRLPDPGDRRRSPASSGSTLAANPDAERLLSRGELVGVWPEGFKGVGKPFSERYKLQRFGRGGFVSAALRTGVPIIPCSIVGAEEIYPIIGNMKTVARLLGRSLRAGHPHLAAARAARADPAAEQVDHRVRLAGGDGRPRPGCGRRPDAGLRPHRPGPRDDPADAVLAADAAPLGLLLAGVARPGVRGGVTAAR